MPDASVTAANVQPTASTTTVQRTFGATVTAGQAVYEDASDSRHCKLAEADNASGAAVAACTGIALNGGADGQPGTIATDGEYDPGFTATEGETYVLSATPGGIAPITDLVTGDYVTILGIGNSNGNIDLDIFASGSQVQ